MWPRNVDDDNDNIDDVVIEMPTHGFNKNHIGMFAKTK